MIKLICLDLDGTTIGDKNFISENNIKAIRRAQDAGIKVIVTTGRSFESAYKYAKQIDGDNDSPIVCFNGASVRELQSGKQIFRKALREKSVYKILGEAKKEGIRAFAYTTKPYHGISLNKGPVINKTFRLLRLRNVTNENEVKDAYKIVLFSAFPSKINKVLSNIKNSLNKFEITKSNRRLIEINSKGVSKWLGVKKLSDKWDIKPDEIAAIGDSFNDYKLMKKVKYSFAVNNAMPDIKEISYWVLQNNNDNSAVAEAIDIILNVINKK